MLVLSRKTGERITIGDDIEVVVQRIAGGRVTLAIEAPRDMRILRGELTPFDRAAPRSAPSRPALVRGCDALRDTPFVT